MLAAFATLDGEHAVDVLRIGDRIEKRGTDPAKDSAVRGYPQRQREHCRQSKARRAAQLSECVSQVCHQSIHRVFLPPCKGNNTFQCRLKHESCQTRPRLAGIRVMSITMSTVLDSDVSGLRNRLFVNEHCPTSAQLQRLAYPAANSPGAHATTPSLSTPQSSINAICANSSMTSLG